MDFETFLPIVDQLLEMGVGFTALQSKVIRARKKDGTPVSNVDKTAQVFVTNFLKSVAPHIQVRGEEDLTHEPRSRIYWTIDPIDATRFYEARRYEWCVSVALVIDGVPRVGIILQPGRGEFVVAIEGKGARFRTTYGPWQIFERLSAINPMLIVPTSKSVLSNKMYTAQAVELTMCFEDTLSLPCVVAGFEVARGPAWGWTSIFEPYEWDIAASYVLIRELGGVARCANGDQVPWGQDKMPPIIFTISTREKTATIAWVLSEVKNRMCA
ncbi:MAG: inositol monophosphatase family protein [Candidatus Adlerbacteria bacterium]|nr:inositol monophosphatase family protein [Candidatus Adlerbacteria bacterium]